MKSSVERQFRHLSIAKKRNDALDSIDRQEVSFQKYASNQERITRAREFYAASRIAALIRGFLDRVTCKKLRRYYRAVLLIQRLMKGKLGRMRWRREYWRNLSVVKSDHALAEILKRSQMLREHIDPGRATRAHWQEFFDPLTQSFWYFNKTTSQNTWQVPFCFQRSLVCTWEGYESFGGMPGSKPCRAVFPHVEAFHAHMRTEHKWYCIACFQCNAGILFPNCPVCKNKFSQDGDDGEKTLRRSIDKVQRQLNKFLAKDMDEANHGASYNLRERLVDIARLRVVTHQRVEQVHHDQALSRSQRQQRMDKINSEYMKTTATNFDQHQTKANLTTGLIVYQPSSSGAVGKGMKVGVLGDEDGVGGRPIAAGMGVHFGVGYNTVSLEVQRRQWEESGGLEGERRRNEDPVLQGLFKDGDFDIVTSVHEDDLRAQGKLNLIEENSSSDEDDDEQDHVSPDPRVSPVVKSLVVDANANRKPKAPKIMVCEAFVEGTCTLTTCPLAHPGLRDRAKVRYKIQHNDDGTKKRLPYVQLCVESRGLVTHCPNGTLCKSYHLYVRPSTEEIVLSLYPIASGQKLKEFASSAKLYGNVVNNQFQGYGTMIWPDGSTYMGDWMRNERHGKGVYRNIRGLEYVGEFQQGKRHGWGVLSSITGEEYIGQWRDGVMEGVGRLTSANGDTYTGHFSQNRYEGVGIFQRANGDVYMGHFHKGHAHGLGVLSLFTREKYKGYFEHNARHGQGVCLYPNLCKYSGYWYRGAHEGFGVFTTPDGDQYIGEWKANRKHGKGRYIFSNLDFYDGAFNRDRAQGMGVYYHANGNIYSGQWRDDKRNGKGTYLFLNGSKYTGHWLDNNIHYKGRFDFANGAFYRGQFDRNTKHGVGIYSWPNGAVYKGEFMHERLHGHGEIQYIHGHRYVGSWKCNRKNGNGVFYYANGAIYEGDFVDDIRHGKGKLTLMPGTPVEEVYEGDWDADNWHGKGKYSYRRDEGMVYEGDWERGIRQGRGLLTFKDGSYYRGEFRKDQMWGKGIFVGGADGSQYDGEWRANMRQGMGTSIDDDGNIYTGEFFGNMKQGHGKLMRTDGTVYEGQWDANQIVGTGKMTIPVGNKAKKDGLPKQITLKVFGY